MHPALLGVLLLASCERSLEIGTGETHFEPLAEGDPIELVHGPQGGYHLVLALRAHRLPVEGEILAAEMRGSVDGGLLAEVNPWVQFREDEDLGWISPNHFLIYDAQPEDLHDRLTAVEVELTDANDRTITTAIELHIWDPIVAQQER